MIINKSGRRPILLVLRAETKRSKSPPSEILEKFNVIELRILKPLPVIEEIEKARVCEECDVAIFMSSIAVDIAYRYGVMPKARHVLAVGPDTALSIRTLLGVNNVKIPRNYTSLGIVELVRELSKECDSIRVVNVYRSAHGSSIIFTELGKSLKVREFRIYKLLPDEEYLGIASSILDGTAIIVFMSSLIVQTFVKHVGVEKIRDKTIIVPGPECANACHGLGLANVIVAENADMGSIYRTVLRLVGQCSR